MRLPMRLVLEIAPILALVVVACTTGTGSPSPAAGGQAAEGTTVEVALQEWAVLPAVASVPAGEITFRVTNNGPDDVHEFVVLRTDVDAGALPTDETGAVSEEGEGMEVIDEIEDIAVGQSQELAIALAAGKYVLLCNIYDETENEAHFKMGMRTPFTVTE